MWDDIAEKYAAWARSFRWYYRLLALWISRFVEPKTALEVGSGPGVFVEELRSIFPSSLIVAIDSSRKMVKISRSILADAHFLPFKDCKFDLIAFCFSLHELDVDKALSEAFRVLKKDGVLAIADLNPKTPDFLKFSASAFLSFIFGSDYAKNLTKRWRMLKDIPEKLEGFKIEKRCGVFDFWLVAKRKNIR